MLAPSLIIFKYPTNILGLILVVLLIALFAGCQQEQAEDQLFLEDGSIKPRVITTVSPITSIVEAVGGERITLKGIVPEGVNSHTFDPPPSTGIAFSNADIIFLNGLYLEEPALDMALKNKREESKLDKGLIEMIDRVKRSKKKRPPSYIP